MTGNAVVQKRREEWKPRSKKGDIVKKGIEQHKEVFLLTRGGIPIELDQEAQHIVVQGIHVRIFHVFVLLPYPATVPVPRMKKRWIIGFWSILLGGVFGGRRFGLWKHAW